MKVYEVVVKDEVIFSHENKKRTRMFFESYRAEDTKVLQKRKNGCVTVMSIEHYIDLSILNTPTHPATTEDD